VIPAVHPRGTDVGGLLRYLFGPGKREEHTNARLVAAWEGADPLPELEPPVGLRGGRDVRRLADMLNQPVRVARKPPELTVWHTSIRLHPTDRVLSDQQWGHIAGEVMAAVGLAPHGDHRAVRWVAVRHAEDHIHLVATLVRQDRRTAWGRKDKLKAQQACRDLEERYNLYRVAPPGQGSREWPSPAELNKTTRLHRHHATTGRTTTAGRGRSRRRPVAPREELRRKVRAVAVAATNETDFFHELRQAGIKVRLRHSQHNPQQVTGYAVGLEGHTNPAGETVYYGGGKLAADLSLPKLRQRWSDPPPAEPAPPLAHTMSAGHRAVAASFPPAGVYTRAERITREAAAALRATGNPARAAGIARAAADVLTATARAWEGDRGGPLTEAAEVFDRAAHDQHVTAARGNVHATRMRSAARLILLNAALSRDDDSSATTRLLLTLAVILDGLAAIREAQRLHHQAEAARDTARRLRSWKPPAAQTAAAAPAASTAPHQHPVVAVPQETRRHRRGR
jgi:hypothetical protein